MNRARSVPVLRNRRGSRPRTGGVFQSADQLAPDVSIAPQPRFDFTTEPLPTAMVAHHADGTPPQPDLAAARVAAMMNYADLVPDGSDGVLESVEVEHRSADTPTHGNKALRSDNATFFAMDVELKLFASELDAAGRKLPNLIGLANGKDATRQSIATIDSMATRLANRIRTTQKQLDDLGADEGDRWKYLADGGSALSGAFAGFEPVMDQIDAWLQTQHEETPFTEIRTRTKHILKVVAQGGLKPRPLDGIEKSPGLIGAAEIDAHLDAALAAAESVLDGNRRHEDRIVLHVQEVASMIGEDPLLRSSARTRARRLRGLVRRIIDENPYMKEKLDATLGLLRDLG